MAAAYLIEEDGPRAGTRVELGGGAIIVGRKNVEYRIDDAHVSHRHAQISCDSEGYYIADLGSRNGTALNGRQLRPHQPERLRDGDRINLGQVRTLVFRCQPSGNSAALPIVVDDDSESTSTIQVQLDVGQAAAAGSAAVSAEVKLRVLFDITRELGRTLTLDAVLPKVLDSLFRVFLHADRGLIVLADDRGELVPRWVKARKPSRDAVCISQTLVRRVVESKQALLLKEIPCDASDSLMGSGISALVSAPLLDSAGQAIGVIQLDTLNPQKSFQHEDLELLASVAVQAGMTIENAQFHDWLIRRKEVDQDLQLANEVQRAFLPRCSPAIPGYEFFNYYRAAVLVGGDYYDYVELPDGRMVVLVADVAGKSMAAAMVMARVSAEAKYCLATEGAAGAAMNRLNDRLCQLQIERFVTMAILVLDPRTHQVTLVNAGHMPPLCRRADGAIEELGAEESGLPLGIIPGTKYQETVVLLRPGESLTLYTDGVSDAMDFRNQCFQTHRICRCLQDGDGGVQVLGHAIIRAVQEFIGSRPQTDDICLVCLGRLP